MGILLAKMRKDGKDTATTQTDMVVAMEDLAGGSKSIAKRAATIANDLTLNKHICSEF